MITDHQEKNCGENSEFIELETHIPLSEKERRAMWDTIANATFRVKHHKKRMLASIVTASSIAACAIFTILISNNSGTQKMETKDIARFAEESIISPNDINTTVLMLSDDNVIELNQRQSAISYKFKEIYANLQKIEQVPSQNIYNQIIVPRGSQSFVTLTDGTMVWVNGGTKFFYPSIFADDKREIYVAGEIYLDVAKDAGKPFIVRTRGMSLEVKGTKFNVSAYPSENIASVLLVEGSVMVRHETSESEFLLEPNEMFENIAGHLHVKHVDPTNYISWVDGYYKYDHQFLSDVIDHLAKYYDKKITYDSGATKLKCSGKLNIEEDFEILLKGLTDALPISVELRSGIYYIRTN